VVVRQGTHVFEVPNLFRSVCGRMVKRS